MQTFIPYGSDVVANARVLDFRRLGKQRVEAYQIVKALTEIDYGWQNHPAVKMWRSHIDALCVYGLGMCSEWLSRGYKDSLSVRFAEFLGIDAQPSASTLESIVWPEWIDRTDITVSHRANLIRKMPEHYGSIWPTVDSSLPYVWPVA
jgi:hypothetical protein